MLYYAILSDFSRRSSIQILVFQKYNHVFQKYTDPVRGRHTLLVLLPNHLAQIPKLMHIASLKQGTLQPDHVSRMEMYRSSRAVCAADPL